MAENEAAMERLSAFIKRGGAACLGCERPTTAEGQLCSSCVARGDRVENDTVTTTLEIRLPEFLRR